MFVMQLDARDHFLQLRDRTMIFGALSGCCFIKRISSGVSLPGFFRPGSSTRFYDVVEQRRDADLSSSGAGSPNCWPTITAYFATRPEWPRVLGSFSSIAAASSNRAEEEIVVFRRGLLQLLDNSRCCRHAVKRFGSSLISPRPAPECAGENHRG